MNELQKKIFEAVARKESGASRDEICYITQIPRTTVYDNLVKFQKIGIIEKYSKSNGKRGRPIIYWKIKGG